MIFITNFSHIESKADCRMTNRPYHIDWLWLEKQLLDLEPQKAYEAKDEV